MKQSYLISLTVLGTAIAGLVLGTNLSGHEADGGDKAALLALAPAMPDGQDSSAAAPAADSPAMTPMDRASIWLNAQNAQAAPEAAVQEAAIPPVKEPESAAPEMAARAEPAMALLGQDAASEAPAEPAAPAPENAAPATEAAAEPAPADDTAQTAAPEPAAPAAAAKAEDAAKAAEPAPAKTAEAAPAAERGILNGYKGYRHHRPGYQSAGDGWWYPRAAFAGRSEIAQFMQTAAAAQIAAPLAAPAAAPAKAETPIRKTAAVKARPRRAVRPRLSEAQLLARHMQWCAARHPSYNKRDNSYRETFDKHYCVSPYSRQLSCR